jgi:hypothetical protein
VPPPSPPSPSTSASRSAAANMDKGVIFEMDLQMDDGDVESRSEGALSPMEMSASEMLAQGRELEARFEALVRIGDASVRAHDGQRNGRDGGLEFGSSSSSEAREFARSRMVL